MTMRFCAVLGAAAVALSLQFAPADAGDNQGDTMVKVFATGVLPESDLQHMGDGMIDVDDAVIPSLSLSYFLTDHFALEAICCFTKHDIDNRALIGDSHAKIADVWIFPPTVSLQYHQQMGVFKPYVGAGLSYFAFFDEKSYAVDKVELKNDWGFALGGGVDMALGNGWQFSLDVKKIFALDSKIYSGSSYVDTVELDPWLVSAGIGYRFNFSDLMGR